LIAFSKLSNASILPLAAFFHREERDGNLNNIFERNINSLLPAGFTITRQENAEIVKGGVWVYNRNEYNFGEDKEGEDFRSSKIKGVKSLWRRSRFDESRMQLNRLKGPTNETTTDYQADEHPMRTDEWYIKINLSPLLLPIRKAYEASLFPQSLKHKNKSEGINAFKTESILKNRKRSQVIKFARNGYVVIIEDASQNHIDNKLFFSSSSSEKNKRITRIGKWRMDTAGISWDIPAKLCLPIRSKEIHESFTDTYPSESQISKWTVLHYHADINLSPFQHQPRMFRGIVTRDRFNEFPLLLFFLRGTKGKQIFRPVIGTFTAEGIGEDTIDFLYKNRGFGLEKGVDPRGSPYNVNKRK